MVASQKRTEHDCHMESSPKHTPLLLRVYEQFLELPVPIVLAVMWLAGVALIGLCGLALYLLLRLLLQALAGD
jgi:hypothetical protein